MTEVEQERWRHQRETFGDSRFLKDLGVRLGRLADGEAEVLVDVGDRGLNRQGHAHGGLLATLVDSALGQAVRTKLPHGTPAVTVDLTVNFVAPGRPGTLRAIGRAIRVGGTLATAVAEVRDEAGKIVAIGSGTMRVFPRTRGRETD